jgi:hypothetical protein
MVEGRIAIVPFLTLRGKQQVGCAQCQKRCGMASERPGCCGDEGR